MKYIAANEIQRDCSRTAWKFGKSMTQFRQAHKQIFGLVRFISPLAHRLICACHSEFVLSAC
jgi:hypothetical protein